MNTRRILVALGIVLAGLASDGRAEEPHAADPGWGSIDGQFLLDGQYTPQPLLIKGDPKVKNLALCASEDIPDDSLVIDPTTHGIANIFVYLHKAPDRIHPDLKAIPAKAELTAKGCRYVPHCGILRVGQDLNVKFTENVAHNAHFTPLANPKSGYIVQPNDPNGINFRFELRESLPIPVVCDSHSWMMCYWTVLDHPYAAITDKDGRFQIEQLPVGEHSFRVWHERCGYVHRDYKVTVSPGCKTVLPIEQVPVSKLQRREGLP